MKYNISKHRDSKTSEDAELIRKIGITKLANRFGYSPQRVFNWTIRGIPDRELLNNKKKFSVK